MATTDNIRHTPCRTTTLPFGHSVLPFTDARTKGRRPKKSGKPYRKDFPQNPPPSSRYPKPASIFTRFCLRIVFFFLPFLFLFPNFLLSSLLLSFLLSISVSSDQRAPPLSSSVSFHRRLSRPSVSPSASLSCHSLPTNIPLTKKLFSPISLNEL